MRAKKHFRWWGQRPGRRPNPASNSGTRDGLETRLRRVRVFISHSILSVQKYSELVLAEHDWRAADHPFLPGRYCSTYERVRSKICGKKQSNAGRSYPKAVARCTGFFWHKVQHSRTWYYNVLLLHMEGTYHAIVYLVRVYDMIQQRDGHGKFTEISRKKHFKRHVLLQILSAEGSTTYPVRADNCLRLKPTLMNVFTLAEKITLFSMLVNLMRASGMKLLRRDRYLYNGG